MKNLSVLYKPFIIMLVCFSLGTISSYASISGKDLAGKVRNSILSNYENLYLKITNNNGEITIKGEVDSYYDKLKIYDITAQVKGVNKIRDLLIVNTEPVPDKIIEQNIKEDLDINSSIIEPDRIDVAVDNGEVILNGNVSYSKEKLLAESIASWQKGVLGVTNNIRVLPLKEAESDDNLKMELTEILKNHYNLEKNIQLLVNNGSVTLKGKVTSLWAKDNIEKDFLNVLGVKSIQNNLSKSENVL